MTTEIAKPKSASEPLADQLQKQLAEVQKAPVLKRGEAATRFAEITVVIVRDLERRITALEARKPRIWRRRSRVLS